MYTWQHATGAFQVHSGGLPAPPNTCKRKYTGGEYLEVTRTSIGGKYFHTVFYIFEKIIVTLLFIRNIKKETFSIIHFHCLLIKMLLLIDNYWSNDSRRSKKILYLLTGYAAIKKMDGREIKERR